MKCLIVFSAFVASALAANGDQQPKVWDALNVLRGKDALFADQIQELLMNVVPGQDFPLLSEVPDTAVDCSRFKQPGFYADTEQGRCQVFHRCDINGHLTGYLCPNMTLFNQITLVCDWFYNVDCSQARQFYDYSNSRLYQEGVALLDDQNDFEVRARVVEQTGASSSRRLSGSRSSSSSSQESQSSSSQVRRRKSRKSKSSRTSSSSQSVSQEFA
ncbi:hypothetical protein RvY_00840 [Ramazzottius varieornatus]|uniref:Chitin-binding type-2 domain-containing protein n=1 Tax=Ramazzottius varieornatus TaxID=947166 RepID=A0A1D1UE66_RAMVA|nr:hypothetical protein RvY_00840 [Ramazzottius varieornatus]